MYKSFDTILSLDKLQKMKQYGLLRSSVTCLAASVILCAFCAVRCEGEVLEKIPSIL